jgi:hypothetical protein
MSNCRKHFTEKPPEECPACLQEQAAELRANIEPKIATLEEALRECIKALRGCQKAAEIVIDNCDRPGDSCIVCDSTAPAANEAQGAINIAERALANKKLMPLESAMFELVDKSGDLLDELNDTWSNGSEVKVAKDNFNKALEAAREALKGR